MFLTAFAESKVLAAHEINKQQGGKYFFIVGYCGIQYAAATGTTIDSFDLDTTATTLNVSKYWSAPREGRPHIHY